MYNNHANIKLEENNINNEVQNNINTNNNELQNNINTNKNELQNTGIEIKKEDN